MKKKFLNITIFLLLLAGSFSACKKHETETPFTEYSLIDTLCQWENLNYDSKVNIVNSNKELEKYIACIDSSYSEIDFSKYTLLLTCGRTNYGILDINTTFLKNNTNKYTLNIIVHLNVAMVAEKWTVAILVSKISDNATIKLNVQQTH